VKLAGWAGIEERIKKMFISGGKRVKKVFHAHGKYRGVPRFKCANKICGAIVYGEDRDNHVCK
jgi:hypothetical protein